MSRPRQAYVGFGGDAVNRRWLVGVGALALVAMSVMIAVTAGSAHAEKFVHRVVAEGAGGLEGQFGSSGPQDVAINQSTTSDPGVGPDGGEAEGYVYVPDGGNHRIQVFGSDGAFRFMFGVGVRTGAAVAEVCRAADAPCRAGLPAATGGGLGNPQGVAIDQATGHVFVRDLFSNPAPRSARVQEFTAAGEFVRAWGWDVVAGNAETGFETCFDAAQCQAGERGDGAGQFATSSATGGGIEVHAASGDILVADPGNRRVQRFDVPADTAAPVAVVSEIAPAAGLTSSSVWVAADDTTVYLPAGADSIARYDLANAEFVSPISISAVTGSAPNATTYGLKIDPSSGNLLVNRIQASSTLSAIFEIGSPAGPASGIIHVDTHVADTGRYWKGFGVDAGTDEVYLADYQFLAAAGEGPAPVTSVAFGPFTEVTATGATVNVTLDGGQLGATYRVQVAPSSDPAAFETVTSGTISTGVTSVAVPVEGLRPGTLYLTRIVAAKLYGNPDHVIDGPVLLTAQPPPAIDGAAAIGVGDTTARLSARINPNGIATRYRFEWGRGGFDNVVPLPDGPVGAGFDHVFISEALSGLEPATTYRFRVVATGDGHGTTTSGPHEFTTRAAPGASGASYELVSPADKVGGAGTGEWYRGLASLAQSGVAAHSGDRFATQGNFGAVLLDSPFSYANDWALAERVDNRTGWVSRSPVSHPERSGASFRALEWAATSADLGRLVANTSNGTYRLFPEQTAPDWAANFTPTIPFAVSWATAGERARWEPLGPVERDQLGDTPPGAGSPFGTWRIALADGGDVVVGAAEVDPQTGAAMVRGLAGDGDPTRKEWTDLAAGGAIYRVDVAGQLADAWALSSPRELVNLCSGVPGLDRTVLPAVGTGGALEAAECEPAETGRDERLVSSRGAALDGREGARSQPPEGTVTADGRRIFFLSPDPRAAGVPNGVTSFCTTASQACPAQLFVRQENGDGSHTTRWLSRPRVAGQDAALLGTARVEAATPDGDKVLFRTNSPLTADDPNGTATSPAGGVVDGAASNNSWDLYLYDFPDDPAADLGAGTLTRVSAGPEGDDCGSPYTGSTAAGPDQAAATRFLSDDGRRVLFTCARPLAGAGTVSESVTAPGDGSSPGSETNLYMYDSSRSSPAERWRFVARVPRSLSNGLDACASTGYVPKSPITTQVQRDDLEWVQSDDANCVRGTHDGGLVTFLTTAPLTSDDPTGAPTADVYGFVPDANRLVRLTASQGGAGGAYACAPGSSAMLCHGDGGVDRIPGIVEGPVNTRLGVATDPLVPGDRIAYFQSAARLVPEDADDTYDVYRWRNGELALMSPDTSDHALYMGNDRSGRNLYIATRDALTWQDYDVVADVYVARVGGGIAEPPPPPVCEVLAGGCQPAGQQPPAAAPESSRPGGGGNVAPAPPVARPRLTLRRPGAAARRRAARTGVLAIAVRTTARRVRVVARAATGGRMRRVARGQTRGTRSRRVVRLRLSRPVRRALRRGVAVRITLRATGGGAKSRPVRVVLRRSRR